MEVQTRSDSYNGKYRGLNFFKSVADAYAAWKEDPNIWKISFDANGVAHRFLPKLKKDLWGKQTESRLNEMSTTYQKAKPDDLYWVDESILPANINEWNMQLVKSDAEYKALYDAACIIGVLSDDEFKRRYNIN